MIEIKNKTICIVGAKRSGLALADLINKLNGNPKITDSSVIDNKDKIWLDQVGVVFEEQGHTKEFIQESDYVVISPAVRRESEPILWAKNKQIPILTEIEFAYQFCQAPVIAVTGSNGKTTVATLIHQVFEKVGFKSCLCGNVGMPFSQFVHDSDKLDYIVLEVSSFQLESLWRLENEPVQIENFERFKPKISLINNFSENHLDRHQDLDEYFEAKKNIFLNQDNDDFAILNKADSSSERFIIDISPKIHYFNYSDDKANYPLLNANELAVMAVCKCLEIEPSICLDVFNEFKGVEHRMEFVQSIDGVCYINDSKSTTPRATLFALNNLESSIILICGGRDKNLDFSIIESLVEAKVKVVIAIGEARKKISSIFSHITEVVECGDFTDAILKANELSEKGDTILLSPMCASFDMFKSFEDRGESFKNIVLNKINSMEMQGLE